MISLCLTSYRRDSLVWEAIQQVVNDERITEIVICDDASGSLYTDTLVTLNHQYPKIKVIINDKNVGCYKNKARAVSHASNEWVYLLDSDNVISPEAIDELYKYNVHHGWKRDTILAPDFAWPTFDYRHFSDITFHKGNVSKFVDHKRFDCLINTANYFFHRDEYIANHDPNIEPWTADTIYTNYRWLNRGNKIHVLKGLQYFHRTDDFKGQEGSHYKTHNKRTNGLSKKIEQKLKQLR
jgi:glycosyltransferase involved in cell wall biosynthesis